jgi:hypothetical protein
MLQNISKGDWEQRSSMGKCVRDMRQDEHISRRAGLSQIILTVILVEELEETADANGAGEHSFDRLQRRG